MLLATSLCGSSSILAAGFAELPPLQQAPPASTIPADDPERLKLEEKLKDLQRRETATQDPQLKVQLLTSIIGLCIELGRDYSAYQAQLTALKADVDRRSAQTSEEQQKLQKNQALKNAALSALASTRLDAAAKAIDAAIALFPDDAETLALQRRLSREMWSRRVRRVSVAALLVVAGAGLVLLIVRVRKGGRVRELEMIEGPMPGHVFPLKKETTLVGALEKDADIVINDPLRQLSRRHCEIARSGRHYFLTNYSTNGTWINGVEAPRNEPVLLRKGDRIELTEHVILRFR